MLPQAIVPLDRLPLNANGKVEYVATFHAVKPVDMSLSSGLMWHDVPNRGGRITITTDLRNQGDVGLSSAWQGDTGMTYQAWQAQWNTSLEELVRAYRAMASTHEANTMSMNARDQAEGAKWG